MGYLFILRSGFGGSTWIIMGRALWIVPSVKDFTQRSGNSRFNRADERKVWTALVCRVQIMAVGVEFSWVLNLISRDTSTFFFFFLLTPFDRKKWQHCVSPEKSHPNKCLGPKSLRRSRHLPYKRSRPKNMGWEIGTHCRLHCSSLKTPTIWTYIVLQRKDCSIAVGWSADRSSPCVS